MRSVREPFGRLMLMSINDGGPDGSWLYVRFWTEISVLPAIRLHASGGRMTSQEGGRETSTVNTKVRDGFFLGGAQVPRGESNATITLVVTIRKGCEELIDIV